MSEPLTEEQAAAIRRLMRRRIVLSRALRQIESRGDTISSRAPEAFDALSPMRFGMEVFQEAQRALDAADRVTDDELPSLVPALDVEGGRRLELAVQQLRAALRLLMRDAEVLAYMLPRPEGELPNTMLQALIFGRLASSSLARARRIESEGEAALVVQARPRASWWARLFRKPVSFAT